MQPTDILQVTALGTAALHAGLLEQHEYTVIHLVGGKRTVQEILHTKRIMKLPPDLLLKLADRGLIAPVPTAEHAEQLPGTVTNPDMDGTDSDAFVRMHRLCQRAATVAGLRRIPLELKIRRASDVEHLVALLPEIAQALHVKHGYKVSRRFLDKAHGIAF